METNKITCLGAGAVLLVCYNLAQPGLIELRQNNNVYPNTLAEREAYGPQLDWLDEVARGDQDAGGISVDRNGELVNLPSGVSSTQHVKLDFSVLSSLMVAGLASGFKSQVANLLWMKSDEYWHQGLFTRQVPLMEAVVTLDPKFVDAWSTAGWHWAYNIYADIPTNQAYKGKGEKFITRLQNNAIAQGLNYLKRGSYANPDTYRLWFEWGWTRGEKAGIYDQETLEHYETARTKADARKQEATKRVGIKMVTYDVMGMDLMGRTIGHLYERIPEFDKAEDMYFSLMGTGKNESENHATLQDRKMLDAVGEYWHKFGTNYGLIGQIYQSGDPTIKARVKALVPDVERLIAADATRQRLANLKDVDQPVGAYVSIAARYMPAWKMMKAGNYTGAIDYMVGVMNADPRYCLSGLPVFAQVLALRGDAPAAIAQQTTQWRDTEKESTQELGLHFLAKIYEGAAAAAGKRGDTKDQMAYLHLAYETWYRSRVRNALDFYALRNTREFEDKYNFKVPQKLVDQIKASRVRGVPNAAPPVPPNVADYYKS